MSGSPVLSSNETKSESNFEDVWRQLGECHQNALQELEAKVAKLKKERCLDAQRLEVFYNRNQQLKEQNKSLQDTISGLEERLRAGECDKCAILEENLKNNQVQNAHVIEKQEQEIKALEDDNRKLNTELERFKRVCSDLQRSSSPETDEAFIPDSPVMASSLPAANKLKKRRNVEKSKFVRYVEKPLQPVHTSLFSEAEKDKGAKENPGKEVLVLNTCELEVSQPDEDPNSEDVVAETCRLDLPPQRKRKEKVVSLPQRTKVLTKSYLLPQKPSTNHSPDSTTDRSLSLLPPTKRLPKSVDHGNTAKRRKEEREEEEEEEKQEYEPDVEKKFSQTVQPKLQQSTLLEDRSLKVDNQSHSNEDETLIEMANLSYVSPVFKKPTATAKLVTQREGKSKTSSKTKNQPLCKPKEENAPREFKVEPMWSIDPALALDMYESEPGADEEEKEENHQPAESMDSDCTWISHSVLQGRVKNGDNENYTSGLGEKANDSLDKLFDTSACGEYKSYHTLPVEDADQEEEEEEEEEEEDGEDHQENANRNSMNRRKPGQPTFAHVAVIRKKDERRKLKGTTCKECEIYYAHLPEEERKKKLSNCSRHRFLYIPPCTPENFWEVGFPSTQTCIERGYIKEDKNPQWRSRRRQPLNALFSPKGKRKEN